MKGALALAVVLTVLGCESTTITPPPPWGTINGVPFVANDAFFLESLQANGDYSLVLIAADQAGYCQALRQNLAAYPANITYATFTFSNPSGSGAVNPGPGTYPVTDVYGPAASAQVSYGSVSNCVAAPALAGTSGNVVMTGLASDVSLMTGTVDVVFGTAGTLSGNFSAPLCDTSNAAQGPSQCIQ